MSFDLKPAPVERSATVHGRIPQLDGLRAVAIFAVFLNHVFHTPLTWVGVDIFFVLSSFLITGILLKRKASGGGYFSYFYWRRAFRILPPYILTLIVFGLTFTFRNFEPWPLFAFFGMNLQRSFSFTHVWNPLPLWSLAVEEQFYFVWPFLLLLVSEKVLFRLAVVAIVVTPFLRFFGTPLFPTQFSIYMLTPFRADLLCAGAVLAMMWKHKGPRMKAQLRSKAWIGCVTGFGGLALVQLAPAFRLSSNRPAGNALDYSLSVLGSFSLVAWTLADEGWLRTLLSSRIMRFLGQISYTMYLVHRIPILLMERHTSSRPLIGLVMLATTILYATLSWLLMERPLIAFAARRMPGSLEGPHEAVAR